MLRLGSAVIALELVALAVAVGTFGAAVWLVAAPVLLGTLLLFVMVRLSEGPRRRLEQRRAAGWDVDDTTADGLMSGFFEIPAQAGPVELRETARS